MARDRKRAKQRREQKVRSGASAHAAEHDRQTRRPDGESVEPGAFEEHGGFEHLSGEVDLADAQLAFGRPDAADADLSSTRPARDEDVEGASATDELLEHALDEPAPAEGGGDGGGGVRPVARRGGRQPEPSRREGNRLATFLRGSWRELQRVQWPDRRQVVQATAVVIGFVLIAGAFLGLMDFLAQKVVNLII